MGYKSSQTIAAISWKTLHTIMKKIYSPFNGEYLQAEPMLSRIHSNDGTDKYSRRNKSVMPNTINSMKYWLPIKFPCPETWVPLKEKIAIAFLITLIIHGDQILTDNQKMEW